MKKISPYFAWTGSLLITAAVLAPLLHRFDQGQGLGLWIDHLDRANLATTERVADWSTGLEKIGSQAVWSHNRIGVP